MDRTLVSRRLYWQLSSLPLVPPGKPIHALNKFKGFFVLFFNCDMKIVPLIAYIQLQAFQMLWAGKKKVSCYI